MPRDDRLKKAQEAGSDFVETALARAEEFLRELARASEARQERAQDALDELLEGSRKGTESILSAIRREIAAQLSLLGIATKADLAELEERLARPAPAAKKASAATPAATTKAPTKVTAEKAAPKKAPATGAAKKAPATGAAKKAPAKKPAG
jgi:valyl-tRNA synthetase